VCMRLSKFQFIYAKTLNNTHIYSFNLSHLKGNEIFLLEFIFMAVNQGTKNMFTIPVHVRSVLRREDHNGQFVSWAVTEFVAHLVYDDGKRISLYTL